MGLDWVAWTNWVGARPGVGWAFFIVYASLPAQQFFCYVRNVHTRANWRIANLVDHVFLCSGDDRRQRGVSSEQPLCLLRPRKGRSFPPRGSNSSDCATARLHAIGFTDAQGLVQLPSFHTILAIMLTYNLRHNRWFFSAALLWNTALILSCPTEGSHYFVDLVAGGVVAAATIWGVRATQRRFYFHSLTRHVVLRTVSTGPAVLRETEGCERDFKAFSI